MADKVFGGYTWAELEEALSALPLDPEGWKMPIRGTVPECSDTGRMEAAIAFFCGSWSEFTPRPDGSYDVYAPGYYLSVGA